MGSQALPDALQQAFAHGSEQGLLRMSICLVMPLLHSPNQQRANFLCKVRPCAPLGVVWPGTRHKFRWAVGIILGSWEGGRKGEGGLSLPGKVWDEGHPDGKGSSSCGSRAPPAWRRRVACEGADM